MLRHSFRLSMTALIFVLLLLGTAAMAQTAETSPSPVYMVEQGRATGDSYSLASLAWQVSGPSSGPGYRLQGPMRPLQGAGCCCTFLPCLLKDW